MIPQTKEEYDKMFGFNQPYVKPLSRKKQRLARAYRAKGWDTSNIASMSERQAYAIANNIK